MQAIQQQRDLARVTLTAAEGGLLRRLATGASFPRFRVSNRIFDLLFALERRGLVDMTDPARTVATDAGRAAAQSGGN